MSVGDVFRNAKTYLKSTRVALAAGLAVVGGAIYATSSDAGADNPQQQTKPVITELSYGGKQVSTDMGTNHSAVCQRDAAGKTIFFVKDSSRATSYFPNNPNIADTTIYVVTPPEQEPIGYHRVSQLGSDHGVISEGTISHHSEEFDGTKGPTVSRPVSSKEQAMLNKAKATCALIPN